MILKTCEILICEACLELKGFMCDTPECVFCRRTMTEVSAYLDVLMIRPFIDGTQVPAILPQSDGG